MRCTAESVFILVLAYHVDVGIANFVSSGAAGNIPGGWHADETAKKLTRAYALPSAVLQLGVHSTGSFYA